MPLKAVVVYLFGVPRKLTYLACPWSLSIDIPGSRPRESDRFTSGNLPMASAEITSAKFGADLLASMAACWLSLIAFP